jgi:hypothetical protein
MELMIMGRDKTNEDPTLDAGCAKKGDIIQMFPDGSFREPFGPLGPNQPYVGLKVPGLQIDEVYGATWERIVDWDILSHVALTDTFQLKLYTVAGEYSPTNGLGKITRTMCEAFLQRWNAYVLDFADNSVTFEAQIAQAIKSEGFWDRDVSAIIFIETAYNTSNGNHTTRADYSATSFSSTGIQQFVEQSGAVVTNHNVSGRTITFRIGRQLIADKFKDDVKGKLRTMLRKRKYHLSVESVDSIIAVPGMIGEMTEVQFGDTLRNKAS